MRNAIFKEQVRVLFKKVAHYQDVQEIAATNPQVARGLALERGLHGFATDADKVLSGAGRLAEKVLTTGSSPNSLPARALGRVSSWAMTHPAATLGTATLAPILLKAFDASRNRTQNDLMAHYQDPTRMVTANLDEFLEMKAASFGSVASKGTPGIGHEILKSFGAGLGGTIAATLANYLGSNFLKTRNALADEPKRRALLQNLFTSDPVIHDALARHPDSQTMLLEAYGTMVKFAPTLSLDINAARSFLREAVLGGAGVNYATIKNLVETERAATESRPQFAHKG